MRPRHPRLVNWWRITFARWALFQRSLCPTRGSNFLTADLNQMILGWKTSFDPNLELLNGWPNAFRKIICTECCSRANVIWNHVDGSRQSPQFTLWPVDSPYCSISKGSQHVWFCWFAQKKHYPKNVSKRVQTWHCKLNHMKKRVETCRGGPPKCHTWNLGILINTSWWGPSWALLP